MSKFKRVTSGLVGVAMAASMFTSMPFSAFAEDEAETNNQTYVYDDYEVSYQVTNSWGDTELELHLMNMLIIMLISTLILIKMIVIQKK